MPRPVHKSNSIEFSKINVLIFDLDNTLIPTRKADKITVVKCAAWLKENGISDNESEDVAERFNLKFRKDPCPEFINNIDELNEWRKNVWKSVLPNEFKEIDELYTFWKEERDKQLTLSEEVQEMLEKIQKRYKIGVLTNGPSVAQWEKWENYGIKKYSATFIVSGDYQIEKPHKEIYDLMCTKMKVSPSECVMIGDRLDTDILGAENAGFGGTIFINWKNLEINQNSSLVPNFTINEVTDLLRILPDF